MPEIILETRRAAARRAMEGEVWQKKREAAAQVLRRRREEAQLAMEGHERRSKRQAAAAAARAQTEARAAAKNVENEKQKAVRQAAESAVETERRRAAQAAAAAAGRQRQAQTTNQTIDRLKARPVAMSPIRTLKTDLAQAAEAGATLTQAIIREQGRETASDLTSVNVPKSRRGWLAILAPVLLLLGGATLIYTYYWPTTIAPPPSETIADPDEKLFLLTDERAEIENLDQNREAVALKLRQALNDGAVSAGRVTRLIPTEAALPLALKPWLERLSISLPEKLIQPLEPKFLLGRYDNIDSPTAFLMLKTKSYEASFSGLRQNEKSLIDLFYRLTGRPALTPATTTPIFTDQLRHNIETRQIKQDDKTILLYVFLDQSTIVIAENENTLEEILNRRNAAR